jgi:Na+/phosphate symporter
MQPRSWNTPFVIMLIIFILLVCFHIIYLSTYSKMAIPVSGIVWFYLILWLVLTLGEAILYYVLRKKIKERKLIWVHLIFSLIGFVGMRFVIVVLSYLTYTLSAMGLPKDFLWYAPWCASSLPKNPSCPTTMTSLAKLLCKMAIRTLQSYNKLVNAAIALLK